MDVEKLDRDKQPLTPVKMSLSSLNEIPKWKKINVLFSESEQRYEVVIDLKDYKVLSHL